MAKDRHASADQGNNADSSSQILLAGETLRTASNRHIVRTDKPKEEEGGISLFWRVFGGTLLSIVALVIITAYTQLTGAMSDLRKDLSQVQADLLKKDEFNNRLTSIWTVIKELQTANHGLVALNERFKVIDQQMDKQARHSDDERREFQRKIEELSLKMQTQAERLATLEGRQGTPASAAGKSNPLLPPRKTKPGTE